MKFGFLDQQQLSAASNGKIDGILELWKQAVGARGGSGFDVVLGNRRDNGSPIRGGVLTESVVTMGPDGERLIIWYDPMEIYYERRIAELGYSRAVIEEITEMLRIDKDPGADCDPVANPDKIEWDNVARQIARWTMRFRGYKKFQNANKNFFELETFLNLEAAIPVLYGLFDEGGWDKSAGVKKRLTEVFEGLSAMDEPARRLDRALNALRISNILEFSTDCNEKEGLIELLKSKFSRTLDVAERIDQIRGGFSLDDPAQYAGYLNKLVTAYKMPGDWSYFDETAGIL